MVDKTDNPYTPPRRAPRVPADGIQLSVEGSAARLVDLSEQGLRFVGDRPFEEGQIVHAAMRAGAEEVAAEATVKWCRPEPSGRYNIGISFRGSNDQALRKGIFALFMAAG